MRILNLTQHAATWDQLGDGVFEPTATDKERIAALLTFDVIPNAQDRIWRATQLVELAKAYTPDAAMIGGAPFFMSWLEDHLRAACVKPLYAFSRRESVEYKRPDGSVKNINVFKYEGFVQG